MPRKQQTTLQMKFSKLLLSLAVSAACLTACDDNTDNIGQSILDGGDKMSVTFDSFPVSSSSYIPGNVYARSTTGYLGQVKDPETGVNVKGNFLTQFYTLEGTQFPEESSIMSQLKDGSIIADSCALYIFYDNYYGDSLATMKLKAIEMSKPVSEASKLYSDFNPEIEGYCRTDEGSVNINKTYTLYDLAADTVPKKIKIKLPNAKFSSDSTATGMINSTAYKSQEDGKYYYNYGTYLMQRFYSDPSLFKNAITFINKVCPGFYFKSIEGLGSMASSYYTQLVLYYKYKYEKETNGVKKDTTVNVLSTFGGTEEVLQANSMSNDNEAIKAIVAKGDNENITYVKSPSGIFTEMTMPVDDIFNGHVNDTLNSARVSLTRVNNDVHEDYSFDLPTTLLMLPKDSLKNFFEGEKLADNKTSFLAVFATSDGTTEAKSNAYTFHNIANLITYMRNIRNNAIGKEPSDKTSTQWQQWDTSRQSWENEHPDWNKVLVVPVTTTYVTLSSTSQLVKVVNDLSMSQTKFVKGTSDNDSAIKIEVVYSKFSE